MKKLIFIILGIVGILPMFSQQNFNITEAINYGLENATQARVASYDLEIAQKKVRETLSLGLPQLNAEIGYQNFIDIPVQVAPGAAFGIPDQEFVELQFGTEHNAAFKFTVSQLILDGSYIIGLKAASSFVQLAELQKSYSESQLKFNIRGAYYNAVLAEENVQTLTSSLEKTIQSFEESQAMLQGGFLDQSTVDQLEISKLTLENELINAQNQLETATMLLKLHMGYPQTQEIQLTEDVATLTQPATATVFNSQENLQYDLLEQQLVLQKLDIQHKQMQRLPSVYGFYNHQQNAYRNEFTFFDSDQSWYPTNMIGLTLSIPVFDSGGQQSRINQSKLEVEKLELQKLFLDEQLKLQYQSAINELNNGERQVALSKRKMELSEKILNEARINFKEGMISSFELSQKEQQFIQEKGKYLQAVMLYLNAKNKIAQLTNQ